MFDDDDDEWQWVKRDVYTGVEVNFTDHDPSPVKVHQQSDKASSTCRLYQYSNITRLFDNGIACCHIDDRLWTDVEHFAADTEMQLSGGEDADVATERVVTVDADGRQRPHRVQSKQYLHWVGIRRSYAVCLPCYPLVAAPANVLRIQTKVGGALIAVNQLTESIRQLTVDNVSVVSEVKEPDVGASSIALPHAVWYDAVWNIDEQTSNIIIQSACSFIEWYTCQWPTTRCGGHRSHQNDSLPRSSKASMD